MSPTRRQLLAGLAALPALTLPRLSVAAVAVDPAPVVGFFLTVDRGDGLKPGNTFVAHALPGEPVELQAADAWLAPDPTAWAAIDRKMAELIGLLDQLSVTASPLDSGASG